MAEHITKIACKTSVQKLQPKEIDSVVKSGRRLHKLNWLEAQTMAKVIEALRPDLVYVDASDVLEERFRQHILECLPFRAKIISEHKADRNYVAVSAASIIAKVERDREIALLGETHGSFGSGYPSDSRTIAFLEGLMKTADEYPEFVRKSWKPAKRVKEEEGITTEEAEMKCTIRFLISDFWQNRELSVRPKSWRVPCRKVPAGSPVPP